MPYQGGGGARSTNINDTNRGGERAAPVCELTDKARGRCFASTSDLTPDRDSSRGYVGVTQRRVARAASVDARPVRVDARPVRGGSPHPAALCKVPVAGLRASVSPSS